MFCETHTSFQIKLNAQARHDADGLWCRVCEGCFVRAKKEEDALHAGGRVSPFISHCGNMWPIAIGILMVVDRLLLGVIRNLTTHFVNTRTKNSEKKYLEVNRLEKRIEKLAQIHQQYESGSPSTPTSSPTLNASLTSSGTGTGSVRSKGLFRSVTSSKAQQLKGEYEVAVI